MCKRRYKTDPPINSNREVAARSRRNKPSLLEFAMRTAVVTKRSIFWAALLAIGFHAVFLLSIFFDPEDGAHMSFRNVG
jgi:hypothetical protein